MSSDTTDAVVRLRGVTKTYDRAARGFNWREALPFRPPRPADPFDALADVDLVVGRGEALGIIGPNGAGKSTVLKIVAGITDPTAGTVEVEGRVGSMIELGMGFHPDLTGRENIACTAAVLGFDAATLATAHDEIVDFAGIGEFLDRPTRTYSTGMAARLGFAIATHMPVDVLVVDEVLSVGDRDFQERCIDRITELLAAGVSLLFVSHEMPMVALVCSRAVHLREGRISDDGPAADVIERYLTRAPSRYQPVDDAPITITAASVPTTAPPPWDPIRVDLDVEVHASTSRPTVGTDLVLPTIVPDVVWVTSASPLPALREPGHYRVVGQSQPFAADAGLVRVVTSIVDEGTKRLCDVVQHDLTFDGRAAKPHLAVEPGWTIEPSPPQGRVGGHVPAVSRDVAAVDVRGISKTYGPSGGDRTRHDVTALDDVDLTVAAGSALGVIGPNGSGKSTLLRVLAGITRADRGSVRIRGSVAPMLGLGLGLHPDLTGRENAEVTSRLMAAGARYAPAAIERAIELAGLGDAIDSPARTYSDGMRARLGFAVAVSVDADVFLVDELLAVGDEEFRRRAIDIVASLRSRGATVLFVSHELRLVGEICDRVIRLQRGAIVDDGPPSEVIERYGGAGWAGGVRDATSGIRLHELRVANRRIPAKGTIEFRGTLEVEEPMPRARIEVAYRIPPDDRTAVLDPDEVALRTFYAVTVEPEGGSLSRPGWYAFEGSISRNEFRGELDLIVSVVDEENTILSDAWQSISIGGSTASGAAEPLLEMSWTVERRDGPRATTAPRRRLIRRRGRS